jgi:hypothetical protein
VIPPGRLTQAASIMLNQYTPQPNTMNMGGMTMMGQPTVIGAGNDANNYLDTRKEHMTDDQGTVRGDHSFANGDTAFIRYSVASEYGFMPEGLPGFGLYHQNLSQQGTGAWNRVISTRMVNMATVAVSRLAMSHTTESASKMTSSMNWALPEPASADPRPGARPTLPCRAFLRSATTTLRRR